MNKLFALLFLTISHSFIFGQIFSTKGTDFWFGFMENYQTPSPTVYISSDVATSGTISIPGQGFSQTFTVAANSTTAIAIPAGQGVTTTNQTVQGKGIHVVANDPVTVYGLNYEAYSSDASIILPTQTLGIEYYTINVTPALLNSSNIPTEFMVVGVQNGTQIEITPSVATDGGNAAGVPFTITLNQGEVYQVQATAGDLTGTYIRSLGGCEKFAVFTGAVCTNVGGCPYCDHLFEQVYPISTWGMNYATSVYQTRNSDLFRILASQNGTNVSINGGAPTVLNAGQYLQQSLSSASFITADQPIMVMQYSKGGDCDGANADPFIITLSPIEQTLDTITFNAFTSSVISSYFVNIISKTSTTNSVFLDGAGIGGFFNTIPSNPTYSYARRPISSGNHNIASDSGVVAYVYGYGSYESYGYVAGASLNNLGVSFNIDAQAQNYTFNQIPYAEICTNSSIDFNGETGPYSVLSWSWDFGDGNTATGQNVSHSYTLDGTYTITLTADISNLCGTETVVITQDVTIENVPPPTTITPSPTYMCPGDAVTLTVSSSLVGATHLWSDGTSGTSTIATPPADSTYNVATSWFGCTTLDTVQVIVRDPGTVPACNVIYVSTTGTGIGTQADPTDLLTALSMSNCNGAIIRMAIGTYNFNNPISTISSFTTIEGGFDAGNGWQKTSLPGATTINRTTSNIEGSGASERIVAIYGNGIHDFRLQDLTITTDDAPSGTAGYGVSTYGMHLTGAYNYEIVRCQILPGDASAGDGDDNPLTYNSTWDGADGAIGGTGGTGQAGESSCAVFSTDQGGNGATGGAGGSGGASATGLGTTGGNGNSGGTGGNGRDEDTSASGNSGNTGSGPSPGTGGAGGPSDGNNSDTPYGGTGGVGGNGTDGVNGTTGSGSIVGGFWVAGIGTNGTVGTGGSGGGGGGGCGRDTGGGCDAAGGGGSGGGGGGGAGGAGKGAYGGGSSIAVMLVSNGTNGNFIDSDVIGGTIGTGGTGGSGGAGGTGGTSPLGNTSSDGQANRGGPGGQGGTGGTGGDGGDGGDGESHGVYLESGTALSTSSTSFGLPSQPTITVENVTCTNTSTDFGAGSSNAWDVGTGGSPATGAGSTFTSSYTTTGFKDIDYGGDVYTGFVNIVVSGTGLQPVIGTTATQYGTDYHVCVGESADFTAVSNGINYIYYWDFDNAISPSAVTTSNVDVTGQVFNTPGTYNITLQIETPCCGLSSSTANITLIVDPIPTPTISSNPGIDVCYGNSTDLTVTGGSTYLWDSGETTATITVTPFDTTTYSVTVSEFECSASTNITVNAVLSEVFISGADQICAGDATTLVANGAIGSTYQWTVGSTATSQSISANPLVDTWYSVVADLNGCTAEDSILVQVTGVSASISASDTTICAGDSTMLVVEGGAYFLWDNGMTNDSIWVSPTTTTTFKVIVTWDSIGTIPCNTVDSTTFTVDVFPVPSISNVSNDTISCTSNTINLTASGGTSYLWSTGETTSSISPLILGDTIFTVNSINSDGCLSIQDTIFVTTIQGIDSITLVGTDASCFNSTDGLITSTVNGGVGPFTYLWSNGDTTVDLNGIGEGT
ncbi:MAG: PKD domain-containing protein, partial [Flavobacteriales bacterium]|nr:PKD domain-containing protein [Flavobacteriales bacterium]